MLKSLSNIVGAVAVIALCFALLFDLGQLTFAGLFTADSYYLPLAKLVPVANIPEMEEMVIAIHTRNSQRQGALFAAIHGVALAAVVVLLVSVNRKRTDDANLGDVV